MKLIKINNNQKSDLQIERRYYTYEVIESNYYDINSENWRNLLQDGYRYKDKIYNKQDNSIKFIFEKEVFKSETFE